MISVLLSIESRFLVDRDKIRSHVISFLTPRVRRKTEVSIRIVGNRKMKALNKTYRNLDATTDVLSFPLNEIDPVDSNMMHVARGFTPDRSGPDHILRLGDVIVSYPYAISQASEENKLVDDTINQLIEHGLNHLLGIHHD